MPSTNSDKITIKEVKSKRDLRRFVQFGIDLYKGNPYYCPPIFFDEMTPYFAKYGIQRVETTSILETNHKSLASFADFEHIQHKRRRAYIKEL